MMMKLSPRERWMLVCLPAFLTAVGYFLFSAHPGSVERERLRKFVAAKGSSPGRPATAESAHEERASLTRQVSALKRAAAAAVPPHDRSRALQLVSQISEQHGLTVIASAPEPSGKLPPALQDDPAPAALWRVELAGPYGGMLELLDALRGAETFIVPLSVSMKSADDERKPLSWTLTLWL